MNDPKLKLAMARLLPEEIQISQCQCGYKSCYSLHNGGICINWIENEESILETEWLYVMHLVEQTLTEQERQDYVLAMMHVSFKRKASEHNFEYLCATFNQRATAMCRVKGIAI